MQVGELAASPRLSTAPASFELSGDEQGLSLSVRLRISLSQRATAAATLHVFERAGGRFFNGGTAYIAAGDTETHIAVTAEPQVLFSTVDDTPFELLVTAQSADAFFDGRRVPVLVCSPSFSEHRHAPCAALTLRCDASGIGLMHGRSMFVSTFLH